MHEDLAKMTLDELRVLKRDLQQDIYSLNEELWYVDCALDGILTKKM